VWDRTAAYHYSVQLFVVVVLWDRTHRSLPLQRAAVRRRSVGPHARQPTTTACSCSSSFCGTARTAAYHYSVLFVVVGMLLPFLVTVTCYWRICVHIQLAKRRILRTQLQARRDNDT